MLSFSAVLLGSSRQGWYSVYDNDTTTVAIVASKASAISGLLTCAHDAARGVAAICCGDDAPLISFPLSEQTTCASFKPGRQERRSGF